ncbi:TetR family transcriptional regulator [Actinorhabdospora filicis]|uniref:TetR family transcriptional regulator n=1 Tax=Actinorhabdospora filicis TaxID=1785913 RepID=A0A9W6SIE8_9ACTN|nr:TetR/AcrR family transcriptional regulator [Actinorhabdospora filicis]GLZ76542.1 TetR family transcriptional regulator [Actinorhabdospora filicis]
MSRGTLRSDAAHNRERILRAARDLFAEKGTDVPMDEVARRAGVGIATVYRRFPTREDLIAAGMGETMAAFARALADAREADPATAFAELLERVRRVQLADRAFSDVMCPGEDGFAEAKAAMHADLLVVIERGVAAGVLRADYDAGDFLSVLLAHAGLVATATGDVDAVSRRFMAAQLIAYGPSGAELPPGSPAPVID